MKIAQGADGDLLPLVLPQRGCAHLRNAGAINLPLAQTTDQRVEQVRRPFRRIPVAPGYFYVPAGPRSFFRKLDIPTFCCAAGVSRGPSHKKMG